MKREKREEILWDLHQEQSELVPLEFVEENAVNVTGVEITVQQQALNGLKVYLMERDVLDKEFEILSKAEVNAENVPKFKALRLKYVKNRTQGVNKWHETESEVSLRYKQFLDAKKRSENAINESREEKLLEGEKFFENQEKENKRLLNLERIEKIKDYVSDTTALDFSEMNEYDFDDFVLGKKTRFEAEKAKAVQAEAERLASEKADAKAREAQRLENKKLKAEADKREKEIEAERAKAKKEADKKAKEVELERAKAKAEADKIEAENQAVLKIERDAKAKIEAELQAKKDAEAKVENERLAKEKADQLAIEKLAKADIDTQLKAWIETFSLEIPEHLRDDVTANEILTKFWNFKTWSNGLLKK